MITVCLATYNGESYILDQLESILKQLGKEDEVLIGDDGSTDGTLDLVEGLGDLRVKVYRNNFGNHVLNFESLLYKASGDYVFLSDQDDIWLNNKLSVTLSEFHKGADLVISDCVVVDGGLNILSGSFLERWGVDKINTYGLIKSLVFCPPHYGCCMAFRREVLNTSLPFPNKTFSHDRWIGFSARLNSVVKYIPEKLILFRRHGGNQSVQSGDDTVITARSPFSLYNRIFRRTLLVLNLCKRKIRITLTEGGVKEVRQQHRINY